MFDRLIRLPKRQCFFLFGARATGKSTLLKSTFTDAEAHFLDLLLPEVEERFSRRPEELIAELSGLAESKKWIVLDEIQKVPKLLDVVHHIMENTGMPFHFAMTGSSGRKLRRGGANLLGGRAFVCDLFPLTVPELSGEFHLQDVLTWGSLPILYRFDSPEEKSNFLSGYVRLYLSEEIQREQLVRNLNPFRHFLEVAAQYDGKIINYSGIAKGIGVDPKTVASYYQILEDTLVGSFLLSFSFSFRKKLIKSPKFYFFDCGVVRAMARQLSIPLVSSTSYFGDVFEQFIYNEIKKLSSYRKNDFKISFYHDENGIQIDFVIERPGQKLLFIEVKSAESADESLTKNLRTVAKDFPDSEFQLWSRDKITKKFGNHLCLFWQDGLNQLLGT